MDNNKLFTVIIPTHERPLLLKRTLASLLAQTMQDFDVVIVSDSSAYVPPYEELNALAGRYTYVIRSGVPGPAESRNMALDLAAGRYIVFLDDDDTFEPAHLENLAKAIGDGKPELLFCDFLVQYENRSTWPPAVDRREAISLADVTLGSIFVRNRVPNSCLAYRRDVVRGVRHDASMRIYEDWDFLLGALKGRKKLVHVPTATVVIHKTPRDAPENLRRGNTREDLTVEVMLQLYKRHAAPDKETRGTRLALMQSAGLPVTLADC